MFQSFSGFSPTCSKRHSASSLAQVSIDSPLLSRRMNSPIETGFLRGVRVLRPGQRQSPFFLRSKPGVSGLRGPPVPDAPFLLTHDPNTSPPLLSRFPMAYFCPCVFKTEIISYRVLPFPNRPAPRPWRKAPATCRFPLPMPFLVLPVPR